MSKKALVLDLGTGSIKMGIVSKGDPENVFIYRAAVAITQDGKKVYGNDITDFGSYKIVKSPLLFPDDVTDDELFRLLSYGISKLGEPAKHSIPCICVLPERPPPQLITRISFSLGANFSFSSFSLLKPEVILPMCAFNVKDGVDFTGVLVSSGESHTLALPIISGCAISDKAILSELGGRDLSRSLARFLALEGCFSDMTEQNIVLAENVKCKICSVKEKRIDFASEPWAVRNSMHYYLQVGNMPTLFEDSEPFKTITLSNGIKLESPQPPMPPFHVLIGEIPFAPLSIGFEEPNISELVKKCIDGCDMGVRGKLWGKILVIGGNTLMKGFQSRFTREIKSLKPLEITTEVIYPHDRELSVWKAAALYAQRKL